MKKIYITPETEVLKGPFDVQPLMVSGMSFSDPSAPGSGTRQGDTDADEHFAKPHSVWEPEPVDDMFK